MVSDKVGKQKDLVAKALKDAEMRFRQLLTRQAKQDKELSVLVSEGKNEDEDIKWLLESGKKKVH